MACHELGALRLGLMKVLGVENEAAKDHDEREVGEALHKDGPIKSLAHADNLSDMKNFFQSSISDLEDRVSNLKDGDEELPYYRSLIILTKKVELELDNQITSLNGLYQNLDEIHDFVHEIYPG